MNLDIANAKVKDFIDKNYKVLFILLAVVAVAIRLINFKQLLYFTWDQGRDYFAVQKIVQGDLTLIGPTTGLHGFFLGPLWFYLGVPGYLLGQGSPFFFSLWYALVTLTAIPLFGWLSTYLFSKNKLLQLSLFSLLCFSSGSVEGSIRILSPMIAIPLMILFYLLLTKSKKINWLSFPAFIFLGLTLQAEFAYAVLFIPLGFFALLMLHGKRFIKPLVYASAGLGLTLAPQLFFEIKNKFVMTTSLLSHFTSKADQITWLKLWTQRPQTLMAVTKTQLIGNYKGVFSWLVFIFLVFLILLAAKKIIKPVQKKISYEWLILIIFAFGPYFLYMFWKGNGGNFFGYYITSHFIFLWPLIIKGLEIVFAKGKLKQLAFCLSSLFLVFYSSYQVINSRIFNPENEVGFVIMEKTISQFFDWAQQDAQYPGTIAVFTPNVNTEHYDAIIHWVAQQRHQQPPLTVLNNSNYLYLLIEPPGQQTILLGQWREVRTKEAQQLRLMNVGFLTLETWRKIDEN